MRIQLAASGGFAYHEYSGCIGILDELSLVRARFSSVFVERCTKGDDDAAVPYD